MVRHNVYSLWAYNNIIGVVFADIIDSQQKWILIKSTKLSNCSQIYSNIIKVSMNLFVIMPTKCSNYKQKHSTTTNNKCNLTLIEWIRKTTTNANQAETFKNTSYIVTLRKFSVCSFEIVYLHKPRGDDENNLFLQLKHVLKKYASLIFYNITWLHMLDVIQNNYP